MAQLLAEQLRSIPGIEISEKVEANMVYAVIPNHCITKLQKRYYFHRFNERTCEVRLMCSFTTQPQQVLEFAKAIRNAVSEK
jgi:threonine aldolase